MARYKYLNETPLPFTLPDGTEHILVQGKIFELPENNEYIRGLEEQGYLAQEGGEPELTSEPKPKPQRSTKKPS